MQEEASTGGVSLVDSSASGGTDLMSELAKALSQRRKGISGKMDAPNMTPNRSNLSGTMAKISDMIPPPPESGESSDEPDDNVEEWND